MLLLDLENSLTNASFLSLFITTLYYWIRFGFFPQQELNKGTQFFGFEIGNYGLLLANLQLLIFFIIRWFESHHFPLSNLYESLLFLSWSITCVHFWILCKLNSIFFLGAITAPSAFFINAFASLTLPETLKSSTPLVPALQSNWLIMHVSLMILSYSLLILGSLFSILILILSYSKFPMTELGSTKIFEIQNKNTLNLIPFLDNLSYRTLGFGFPLLTIGIISGAVWANQAWGSYWSWDPKETWAFITWLTFAIYFHFRLNKNWQQEKSAIIATIGFVLLWICYLGVNLLGKGLHSYGWFG